MKIKFYAIIEVPDEVSDEEAKQSVKDFAYIESELYYTIANLNYKQITKATRCQVFDD